MWIKYYDKSPTLSAQRGWLNTDLLNRVTAFGTGGVFYILAYYDSNSHRIGTETYSSEAEGVVAAQELLFNGGC